MVGKKLRSADLAGPWSHPGWPEKAISRRLGAFWKSPKCFKITKNYSPIGLIHSQKHSNNTIAGLKLNFLMDWVPNWAIVGLLWAFLVIRPGHPGDGLLMSISWDKVDCMFPLNFRRKVWSSFYPLSPIHCSFSMLCSTDDTARILPRFLSFYLPHDKD